MLLEKACREGGGPLAAEEPGSEEVWHEPEGEARRASRIVGVFTVTPGSERPVLSLPGGMP